MAAKGGVGTAKKRTGASRAGQEQKRADAPTASALVGMVPPGTALKFLAAELRRGHPGMLDRFAAVARAERAKTLQKDYKAAVEAMFKKARGRRGYGDGHVREVRFAESTKDAGNSERLRDYAEAARVYGGVCEALAENIDHRDSDRARFEAQMRRCLRKMAECAGRVRGEGERGRILSSMARVWISTNPYGYELGSYVLAGLTDAGDADSVLKVLGEGRPRDRHDAADLARFRRRVEGERRRLAAGARGGEGAARTGAP